MLKLPGPSAILSSLSCNATSSDIKNPKALMKKQCRLFGTASHSSSRLTISIRQQNTDVSCEVANPFASSLAHIIAEIMEKDADGEAGKSVADRLRLGSLTEDGLSYKERFKVRCYEVGSNKTATVDTIANFLQEVTCNHLQCLGYSTDGFATTTSMRQLGLIWVAADMHIGISKYPAWGDVVEVETWLESKGRMGTRRHWILKDYATREIVARAMSKFVMINQDTRKYEKASDVVQKDYLRFCQREPRMAFSNEENGSVKKLPQLEEPAQYCRLGLVPRRADVDMNQHVNNVAYIRWVLEWQEPCALALLDSYFVGTASEILFSHKFENYRIVHVRQFNCGKSMPQEIIDTHELETIVLHYKQECRQDDVVDCHTSPEPFEDTKVSKINGSNGTAAAAVKGKEDCCQFLHSFRLPGNGLEMCRCRTEWRTKPTRHANHSA